MWNVHNSDKMFTYEHTQVPAYVHSSAGQLVGGAELNKETVSRLFFPVSTMLHLGPIQETEFNSVCSI